MRVKADNDCESGLIVVKVKATGEVGNIIGTNKKAMKYGRLYTVRFNNNTTKEFEGGQLEEVKQ